ncbi:hypothetical protein GC163_15080 [bacterium]|nr:hypothetical protein [bacterium]
MIPILFLGLFLGVLGWFGRGALHWESLTGELTGVELESLDLPSQIIPCNGSSLGSRELADLLEKLEYEPIILSGDLMQVQIRGHADGLSLSAQPGKKTVWYSVSTQQHADLNAWLTRESARLEAVRAKELTDATHEFLELVRRIHNDQASIQEAASFRDRLVLPGLVRGLGYHVAAIAEQREYRCIRETSDGTLYFLLPSGLHEFRLVGRKLSGAETSFPGDFLVKISEVTTTSCQQEIHDVPTEPATIDTPTDSPAPDSEMEMKPDSSKSPE